jgi:hypothetical protein
MKNLKEIKVILNEYKLKNNSNNSNLEFMTKQIPTSNLFEIFKFNFWNHYKFIQLKKNKNKYQMM